MTTTTLLAITAATASLILVLRQLDRAIRRRRQIAFLTGPLRQQLQFMIRNHVDDRTSELKSRPVLMLRPVALLNDHRLSA